ncbi:MAG TPA: dihydropteroate synthase [Acidimicrobiales bacterium]|nr:dihydropteroate synthase [Acidimicrobiales bacterium]
MAAAPAVTLRVGNKTFDITHRAVVMAILNRTPDSFFDRGAFFDLAATIDRAAEVVAEGADILDVGGVKAGPGPEVGVDEELSRVVPAVEALRARFDVPVSVDTWRATVASAAYDAGASMGNDISGFADPDYLPAAARAGASVVATHIRLAPRVPDPEPHYDDVVATVRERLCSLAAAAVAAGIPSNAVIVDAGLDLGKTWSQSVALLRASRTLAGIGHPLLLSASNKTFLGRMFDLDVHERRDATTAAHAVGVVRGCRVLRVHDARAAARVRDALAALGEAKAG